MISFFKTKFNKIIAVESSQSFDSKSIEKLNWLFAGELLNEEVLRGAFVGPKKEMISPWSTNAVEITQNMGVDGIIRIEEFKIEKDVDAAHDSMLEKMYPELNQELYKIDIQPAKVEYIDDIAAYNEAEGLALNAQEVAYLENVSKKVERKLTDSEVFGFSQVNSEHCRHKIFNGQYIIDGEEKELSLFNLIRKTSDVNPNKIVSAYKDNVSFVKGPKVMQFAPKNQDKSDFFETKEIDTVLSLKAETHNFPTTVEPFNGAATGGGGEIRDRMAGGKGSVPMSGSAVYMTSYSRLEEGREWEDGMPARDWLYQSPVDILIKASNGASDFGNKFGQPLINGSVLTFEHSEAGKKYGFDKVIMLAGGIGYGKYEDALKEVPQKGDKIVVLGGDNYRIGMGGSAVSSVDTGELSSSIELNAIQRSNPEMQKRAFNAVRAFSEASDNKIVSIHDHGAGGHLNCLSELVEDTGGLIQLRELPVGDPTLSAKEIVGNESQERMGLVIKAEDVPLLADICERERSPMYVVGEITGDHRFRFEDTKTNEDPIDLAIDDMFGNPPKTIIEDKTVVADYKPIETDESKWKSYLTDVLQLEAVACKDWLTNKVDRSVTGKVAQQQCVGELQLPLSNLGAVALDYKGEAGIATSIGHSPVSAMIDPKKGSQNAIAESLTNLVWAPLSEQLKSVSLSANWMWPCKNEGEDARLYEAVEEVSDFACALGINIPTGKDSLSMVQKYKDEKVYAPGTVIISASGEISDVKKVVTPDLKKVAGTSIVYVDFSGDDFLLGGSSLAQVLNKLGDTVPGVNSTDVFAKAFNQVQTLIENGKVLAGHDISSGGLITSLLEMTFPLNWGGLNIDLSGLGTAGKVEKLFSEKSAVVLQVENAEETIKSFQNVGVNAVKVADVVLERNISIDGEELSINELRDTWYKTSYLLDQKQSTKDLAKTRYESYSQQERSFQFSSSFTGQLASYNLAHGRKEATGVKAAIIREKGVNGDREMAYSMFLAGFDVKDVHMTDLMSGKEDLSDVNFIVFVGGFSNSDVLGSAKGWAGGFKYNEKAKAALDNFYARKDTLSLGVCNGCQLMSELGLVNDLSIQEPMEHNDSGKFESNYVTVQIPENNSIMLSSLAGNELGIWVAHGEGKFKFNDVSKVNIPMKYSYSSYPMNPNGSPEDAAAVVSADGRHLAMMPHLERAIFPWQCGSYDEGADHEVTPWFDAFVNARKWVEAQ